MCSSDLRSKSVLAGLDERSCSELRDVTVLAVRLGVHSIDLVASAKGRSHEFLGFKVTPLGVAPVTL